MRILFKDKDGNIRYGTFCSIYPECGKLYLVYPNPNMPSMVCKNPDDYFFKHRYPDAIKCALEVGYWDLTLTSLVFEKMDEIQASSEVSPTGMQTFMALRDEAKKNGIQDLSLDEINEEIRMAREGMDE